jgi:hypothetical protein
MRDLKDVSFMKRRPFVNNLTVGVSKLKFRWWMRVFRPKCRCGGYLLGMSGAKPGTKLFCDKCGSYTVLT